MQEEAQAVGESEANETKTSTCLICIFHTEKQQHYI